MLSDLSKSIASLGFVVVAPATRPCGYSHLDILYALKWSKNYSSSHPALAHVDWSRAAVFGHSFGGVRALCAANMFANQAAQWRDWFNIKAVVASHGFTSYVKKIRC
jgi:predicted dienelactone hydrolase